jgi:hypothetical protein
LGIYGCQNNLFNDLLRGGQFAVKKGGQFGVKMGGQFPAKLGGQFQRFFHNVLVMSLLHGVLTWGINMVGV